MHISGAAITGGSRNGNVAAVKKLRVEESQPIKVKLKVKKAGEVKQEKRAEKSTAPRNASVNESIASAFPVILGI